MKKKKSLSERAGEDAPRAAAASEAAFPAKPEGMAPSVTRHAQISEGPTDWSFQAAHIDSLDVNVYVAWGENWPELVATFDQAKDAAKGTDGVLLDGFRCLMMPSGSQRKRWHLKFDLADIFISEKQIPAGSAANVFVSFRSVGLWWEGTRPMVDSVATLFRELGAMVVTVVPSRVDIAADFHIPGGLSQSFLDSHRVPVGGKTNVFAESGQLETYYVGATASPKRLRIYDKSLEVAKNGTNNWLHKIWPAGECESVWRIEFQLRRTILREYGIETVDDLLKLLCPMWLDLTENFFSLRLLDNENVTRRTTHPFWEAVQDVARKLGVETDLETPGERPPADASWYPPRILGYVLAYAVRARIANRERLLAALRRMIESEFTEASYEIEYRRRSIKLGFEEPLGFGEAA